MHPCLYTQQADQHHSVPPKLNSMPPSSTPTNPASNAGSLKLCTNYGRPGHWVTTCFEPGGGMEG